MTLYEILDGVARLRPRREADDDRSFWVMYDPVENQIVVAGPFPAALKDVVLASLQSRHEYAVNHRLVEASSAGARVLGDWVKQNRLPVQTHADLTKTLFGLLIPVVSRQGQAILREAIKILEKI